MNSARGTPTGLVRPKAATTICECFSMRLLVFLLSMLFALGAVNAEDDADTLTVDGSRYRLDGIDAPELDQPCLNSDGEVYLCGRKAYEELQKFVGNKVVRCDDK